MTFYACIWKQTMLSSVRKYRTGEKTSDTKNHYFAINVIILKDKCSLLSMNYIFFVYLYENMESFVHKLSIEIVDKGSKKLNTFFRFKWNSSWRKICANSKYYRLMHLYENINSVQKVCIELVVTQFKHHFFILIVIIL